MKIERLSTSPDRAGRYYATLSNGEKLRLYRGTLEDFGIYPGMELDEATLAKLKDAAGKMSAKMRAVRIVAASSVSRRDLQERLIRKGENEKDAIQAVAWMEEHQLVDDRATARQVVQSCAAKGYGRVRANRHCTKSGFPANSGRKRWMISRIRKIKFWLFSKQDSETTTMIGICSVRSPH